MTITGVPVGIATGIYLAEYAPRGSRIAGVCAPPCRTSLAFLRSSSASSAWASS
jgi:hypothetical protein